MVQAPPRRTTPAPAPAEDDNGGFTIYFSDRRNNRNAASQETGEYGWEDFVNPAWATGTPNDVARLRRRRERATRARPLRRQFPSYNGSIPTAASRLPPQRGPPDGCRIAADQRRTADHDGDRGEAQVNRADPVPARAEADQRRRASRRPSPG